MYNCFIMTGYGPGCIVNISFRYTVSSDDLRAIGLRFCSTCLTAFRRSTSYAMTALSSLARSARNSAVTPAVCSCRCMSTASTVPLHSETFTADTSQGGPLIMLHGLYGSAQNWRSVAKSLRVKLKRDVHTLVRHISCSFLSSTLKVDCRTFEIMELHRTLLPPIIQLCRTTSLHTYARRS